jgi:alkylation response protein AidB-like acyl-CoA dehydrogenase
MTAWHRHTLDPVHTVHPTASPYDTPARTALPGEAVRRQMAERVTSQALQTFGGHGYTTQFSAERYWRDARLTRIFVGTSEIQRRIIPDSLLAGAPVEG